MGSWQGDNYEEIPPPDDPKDCTTAARRAALYRKIKDLGHPALMTHDDKKHFARKFDISYRQVQYDMDAVADYVAETLDLNNHLSSVSFVFEKAMSEAIEDGDWQEAADIAMQQAEWLERRGIIENKDVDKAELTVKQEWRQFVEADEDDVVDLEENEVEVLEPDQ